MFLTLPPSEPLMPYVRGYWFVQDIEGRHEGQPIVTSPHPGAVLSVNFGRPNAMEDGPTAPRTSLLGLQSASRRWKSWADTNFVMVMLSCEGLVRLFPHLGREARDELADLGGLIGARASAALADDLDGAWAPPRIAGRLDQWLAGRLATVAETSGYRRFVAAQRLLRAGAEVQETAVRLDIGRRQLTRWYERHIGFSPKQVMDLERLQNSVRAVQNGRGDPVQGYSDQAQQIRGWRRRLDLTPGAYRRSRHSPMAEYFGRSDADAPAFYL